MTDASQTFRAHPASLRLVREFVRTHAAEAHLERLTDDLVLAASEAAGNAIVHAVGDRVEVRWSQWDDVVEMEVEDQGIFKRRSVAPASEEGRGLSMMLALMDEVSIREGRPGKPGTLVRLRKRIAADPGSARPTVAWGI